MQFVGIPCQIIYCLGAFFNYVRVPPNFFKQKGCRKQKKVEKHWCRKYKCGLIQILTYKITIFLDIKVKTLARTVKILRFISLKEIKFNKQLFLNIPSFVCIFLVIVKICSKFFGGFFRVTFKYHFLEASSQ